MQREQPDRLTFWGTLIIILHIAQETLIYTYKCGNLNKHEKMYAVMKNVEDVGSFIYSLMYKLKLLVRLCLQLIHLC